MFIRTEKTLYDTTKARYFEVYTNRKYGEYDAQLEIVYGFLEREGCADSVSIFSGTEKQCQNMLDRIASAITQGEIIIFTIKGDGTKRTEDQKPEVEKGGKPSGYCACGHDDTWHDDEVGCGLCKCEKFSKAD